MSFTSLNNNPIFQKIEKIKVLRTLFLVELKYKFDWSMKITCKSFFQLLPKVLTLLAIMFIMYSYFGLILVKVYKDDFYSCQNYPNHATITNQIDCLNWGGDWVQFANNTANLFNSTLYLFFIATMEGWISLLYPMMNLSGSNQQPVLDHNKYISIFVTFFFFFGNLIMLNVFIGLSVSNFKRLKDKTTGESKLSKK
jgi:voltage-dependent calcium channel T type alpha-1G